MTEGAVRYCFGDHALEPARRDLRYCGHAVALEPQVFDLLAFLIRERDRVVSRDDLLQAVWCGRVVSDSTLASRINAARKAIGDNGEAQCLIRTIQRKGFRFVGEVREESCAGQPTPPAAAPPPPDRPSLAVLPFDSIGDDPADTHFADGMTEEIVTALGRLRSLLVIAPNRSLAERGRGMDTRTAGQALGARYVLTGSVRRSGARARFNGQLLDAGSGVHLWTERYDGVSDDLFELQDRAAEAVAARVEPAVERAEIERVRRCKVQHGGCHDHYFLALSCLDVRSPGATEAALAHATAAITLDAGFAPAYVVATRIAVIRRMQGFAPRDKDRDRDRHGDGGGTGEAEAALALVEQALRADRSDPAVLAASGLCIAWLGRDLTQGLSHADAAIAMSPNHAHALAVGAALHAMAGDVPVAMQHAARFRRLDPYDSQAFFAFALTALSCGLAGDDEAAHASAVRATQANPDFILGWLQIAACRTGVGCEEEALAARHRVLAIDPAFSTACHCADFPPAAASRLDGYQAALLGAGLPR